MFNVVLDGVKEIAMEKNLENPKMKPVVEKSVSEPIIVGKFDSKAEPEDDDLDLDIEIDEEESDDDDSDDSDQSVVDEVEEEVHEPVKEQKPLSKEQKKILALKNEAKKLQESNAALAKQLAEKQDAGKEEALAAKYAAEEGLSEQDARKRARSDLKQSELEKTVSMLLFEKTNRKALAKFPQAEDNLETIYAMSKASGMTAEQVCRGLYGTEVPARERRAVSALLDDDEAEPDTTVARSVRTASAPVRSKLTREQKDLKAFLENKFHKKLSDKEFLEINPD